jgi:DNA-binding LacI/PurR family transcriptional regulator
LDQNPAGILLLNYDKTGDEAFSFLSPNIPVVMLAGDRNDSVSQISMKEHQGGYRLTSYLLELGHKTVYHVSVPGGGGGYSRLAGWRSACEDAGAPAPTPIPSTWDPENGREIGRRLGKDLSVTAIFAGNDEIAMGVIRGLNDVGRRVPEDVSVAGFDDHPISKVWNPGLTTIRQNFNEAGATAFDLLKNEIDDVVAGREHSENWNRFVEISGELVIRESTGPLLKVRNN